MANIHQKPCPKYIKHKGHSTLHHSQIYASVFQDKLIVVQPSQHAVCGLAPVDKVKLQKTPRWPYMLLGLLKSLR